MVKAINEAFREKEEILPLLREHVESSLAEDASDRIAAVDEQVKALQLQLLATADMKNPGMTLVWRLEDCAMKSKPFRLRKHPNRT